jgi:Carboxypeptidase regulatory-like domain
LIGATTAFAQSTGRIDGKVVDESGRAIAGARVELTPGERRIVSDEDGTFRLLNVAVGTYAVATQRIGYKLSSSSVAVTASGAKLTIVLAAIPQVLDSIRIHERAFPMRYSALVVDESGRPIPDVSVVVAGVDNTIRTDSLGHFAVPKQLHFGTPVMVRMRKIGYGAYFGTKDFKATREDTLRMSHLAQGLSAVQIDAESGFGRDTFVFKDLDQRTRWRPNGAGAMPREFLAKYGTVNLCELANCKVPTCIILNGEGRTFMPVSAFYVDEIEMVEIYPPKTDWSGNLAARGCRDSSPLTRPVGNRVTYVIWTRKDTTRKP